MVLGLLLVVRLMTLYSLGFGYTLNSDDASYINSGITFARTGTITMHNQYPSAQIMPGMTVLIGLFVLVFGEGKLLWLSLKLLWILMDLGTAWFLYRSVSPVHPQVVRLAGDAPPVPGGLPLDEHHHSHGDALPAGVDGHGLLHLAHGQTARVPGTSGPAPGGTCSA